MRHEYLKFNKNILIALAVSLVISAVVAQVLSDQAYYLNTTYTTVTDSAVYFTVFGFLFYLDNRRKYRLESGGTDTKRLRHDLKKLITSLGIGEVVYNVSRWGLQYYLLTLGHDPYIASIMSQVISTVIYMAVINLSIKMTRLYKDG